MDTKVFMQLFCWCSLTSWVWLFVTPWTIVLQVSLSFTISQSLFILMSVELVMLSHHFILCHSLPFCLQFFPASGSFPVSRLFASGGQSTGPSSISPSNEYSRVISFRIDCLDLLAIWGTVKSILQHHNWKASVLWCSGFFMVNSHILTWLLKRP